MNNIIKILTVMSFIMSLSIGMGLLVHFNSFSDTRYFHLSSINIGDYVNIHKEGGGDTRNREIIATGFINDIICNAKCELYTPEKAIIQVRIIVPKRLLDKKVDLHMKDISKYSIYRN